MYRDLLEFALWYLNELKNGIERIGEFFLTIDNNPTLFPVLTFGTAIILIAFCAFLDGLNF